MNLRHFMARISVVLFAYRGTFLLFFTLLTLALATAATRLQVDAGFEKMVPLEHPYMQVFSAYRDSFGGANRILVALMRPSGDIYDADFFATLRSVTDEVFFLPGVDRATVTSLFTPNVRFIEIIEEGFAGGNVIPATFSGTAEDLAIVRANVLKSGQVGRLVANDHQGALISAELLSIDPQTGARLDLREVARALEEIRAEHSSDDLSIHIIGFAKAVGDITDGARGVVLFFGISFAVTGILLFLYSGSLRLALLTLFSALIPVVWLLGALPLLGFGIDPMSILLPFLLFAIAVSHAVQMSHAWRHEMINGLDPGSAAQAALRRLFIPGAMALITTAVGFLVIMRIEIAMVQELALTAGLGVSLILISNLFLLPLLLAGLHLPPSDLHRARQREVRGEVVWQALTHLVEPRNARIVLLVAAAIVAAAAWQARDLRTGDLGTGVPELRADSRYNQDSAVITDAFSIGVNLLSVIAQTYFTPAACTDHTIMQAIDQFEVAMRGVYGVQSVIGLAGTAKRINAGWNEGDPRWQALARDPTVLAQSVAPIDTGTGLLNTDCTAMQILIFTRDHDGATIAHVLREAQRFRAQYRADNLDFLFASGNVGVMAATNEAVDAAALSILLLVFGAISLLFFAEFRSLRATLTIVLPLLLVAVLCSGLMALLGIGLKVSTLPVIAIAVGIGVDYGIYLYERMSTRFAHGDTLAAAYLHALRQRGTAVMFTAATMSVGVGTWTLSQLKFQADMGLLMAFMFLVNMLAALILLPALAAVFNIKKDRRRRLDP